MQQSDIKNDAPVTEEELTEWERECMSMEATSGPANYSSYWTAPAILRLIRDLRKARAARLEAPE